MTVCLFIEKLKTTYMELKHRDFFGESGLTSTSANYVANKAKEYYSSVMSKLEQVSFVNADISIIGSGEKARVSTGYSSEELEYIPRSIKLVAELKTLIAYLREAIKEKDRLHKKARIMTFEHDLVAPEREEYLEEEDIIESWSKEKMMSYYRKETLASTLGKLVHPSGAYSKARKAFHSMVPTEYKADGRDTIIRHNTYSVLPNEVDDTFFKLQEEQRNAQAELNGMKHEIELALQEDRNKKDESYKEKLDAYLSLKAKYEAEDKIRRNLLLDEIQGLKIVIPDSLKEIYEAVSKDNFASAE